MHLLHLVLAGFLAGATANDYGGDDLDNLSKEQIDRSLRRSWLEELQPLIDEENDSEAKDLVAIPRKSHKKRLHSLDFPWLHKVKSTTTRPNRHTTSTHDNWIPDLMRAVQKLGSSVDNLYKVVQHVNTRAYINSMKDNPRLIRDKRDVANTKTTLPNEPKNEDTTTNTSAPDDGVRSNDKIPDATAKIQNGRRSGHPLNTVKGKLLLYLDEGFDEIWGKVSSLRKIKERFANIPPYKIGYIVANVDTLAVSIKNLREEAGRNRQLWEEREILDVYDRLKVSNSLLTKLLDTLKVLIENL